MWTRCPARTPMGSGARRFSKLRVNVWTAPRSASTSLMYSFAQRSDTKVYDEPLYASRLKATSDVRPYSDQLLRDQDSDWRKVRDNVIMRNDEPKPVLFFKHMAKDVCGDLELDFAADKECRNVILLRHPRDVAASYSQSIDQDSSIEGMRVDDTGFTHMKELSDFLTKAGKPPIVLSNQLLLERPEGTLRALCEELGIPFERKMLKWEKGGIPEDGCWAYFWYHSSHASTGFESKRGRLPGKKKSLSAAGHKVVEECMPVYNELHSKRLRPKPILPDERNEDIYVWVNGLKKRQDARVSVFDSSVQGGDAVWEGVRIYDGRVFALDDHLKRLQDSSKAMMFEDVPSNEEIKQAIFETLNANGMFDQSHIRLTLTRGEKVSSGMSPLMNQSGCTLIVLAEWKKPVYDNDSGIRLVTSTIRRNGPSTVDSKIHHNNLINNILAKIESNLAGVDDALMLDAAGFTSETNATNIFFVRNGELLTPKPDYCLPGITRKKVIKLARDNGIGCTERNVSLVEAQTACEMFTTGTMGELSPVLELDGRQMGDGEIGPVTRSLQALYTAETNVGGTPIPRLKDVHLN